MAFASSECFDSTLLWIPTVKDASTAHAGAARPGARAMWSDIDLGSRNFVSSVAMMLVVLVKTWDVSAGAAGHETMCLILLASEAVLEHPLCSTSAHPRFMSSEHASGKVRCPMLSDIPSSALLPKLSAVQVWSGFMEETTVSSRAPARCGSMPCVLLSSAWVVGCVPISLQIADAVSACPLTDRLRWILVACCASGAIGTSCPGLLFLPACCTSCARSRFKLHEGNS